MSKGWSETASVGGRALGWPIIAARGVFGALLVAGSQVIPAPTVAMSLLMTK